MKPTFRYLALGIVTALFFAPLVRAQEPPPAEKPRAAVIRFFAPIDSNTVGALLQMVDTQYKAGVRKFIILMSTPGGDVLSGFVAYNYLKGLPIELTTFNVGNVDSAGGIIFCAGTTRYAVPDARFLIHEVSLSIVGNGQLSIDLPSLESQVAMLKSQESTIAKILATTVHKPQSEAETKIHAQAALSAQEAKDWGLVQDIRTELFDPANSNLVFAVPPPPPSAPPNQQPTLPLLPQFSYSGGEASQK